VHATNPVSCRPEGARQVPASSAATTRSRARRRPGSWTGVRASGLRLRGLRRAAARVSRRTMRAAVMEGVRQPLVVREVDDPTPAPNGVVLRVEANGICRSDWHLWTGDWSWFGLAVPLPHVLGHEFCGVVEEVGPDVTRWSPGDRVLVPFSMGEGTCEWCRTGHHNVCDTMLTPGIVSWGGYARRAAVPFADVNLGEIPE